MSRLDITTRPTARQAGAARPAQWVPLVLLVAVVAVFAGYFIIYLVYARALFAFPFDYDQGEGFELYDAIRLAAGQNIYLDNSAFPFYSSNYPPVYRLMIVPLIWLFGPHIWTGRVVAFACSLVIGVLVFLAARRVQKQGDHGMSRPDAGSFGNLAARVPLVLAPLVAALAFFAANYVYYIGPLARAHIPMVMFAFAGILCLDIGLAGESDTPGARARRWWTAAGVAFLIVAGFTKLQAVDALAAGFGFLLIRKPKLCLQALLASALAAAVIVVALNAATQGQFWLNVVLANVNEYDIQRTWMFYGQWFRLQGALIVCSALYVVWDIVAAIRARSLKPITVWSMYFAAGAAIGMLTGKWGAGPTYLVAAIAASCVCTVGLLWRVSHWGQGNGQTAVTFSPSSRRAFFALLMAGVFFVQAALNLHLPTSGRLFGTLARLLNIPAGAAIWQGYPYYDVIGDTQLGHLLDPADEQAGWELARLAREAPGPVWSEEAMITLHAGKGVVTNPTQLLNLAKSGKLDTANMLRMIENQEFGAVIFRAQFYPNDVLIAIRDHYGWGHTIRMNGFDYLVLYPRARMETEE